VNESNFQQADGSMQVEESQDKGARTTFLFYGSGPGNPLDNPYRQFLKIRAPRSSKRNRVFPLHTKLFYLFFLLLSV